MKLASIFTDYVASKIDGGKKEFKEPGYIVISLPNGIHLGFDYSDNRNEDQINWTMTFIEKKSAT